MSRRTHQRDEVWKLGLNLSVTCAVAGVLFALIGAWLAASFTFVLGLLLALCAGLLLRRAEVRAAAQSRATRPLRRVAAPERHRRRRDRAELGAGGRR